MVEHLTVQQGAPDTLRRSRSRGTGDPVPWIGVFFVANLLLQRVSALPSLSISASTPLVLLWLLAAYNRGLITIDRRRLVLWMMAAGMSALMVIPQLAFVPSAHISVTSWLFWLVIWLPMVARFRETGSETYRRVCSALARIGVVVSAVSVLFMVVQFLGLEYTDYVGRLLPDALEVGGFIITYPVAWDSPIYKSNAWVALEPSYLSFTLGICAMCSLWARERAWVFVFIFVGILSTVAGSGLAVLGAGLVLLALQGRIALVRRQLLGMAAVVAAAAFSPLNSLLFSRVFEASNSDSSATLRSLQPYGHLVPRVIAEPIVALFGDGAGSSRLLVDDRGIIGLLTPNAAKVLFDYGLVAGALLLAVIVVTHTRSPYPALGYSLLLSFFTIQAASQPLLNCVFAAVTWWAAQQQERGVDVLSALPTKDALLAEKSHQ